MATTYTELLAEVMGYTTRGDVEQIVPTWVAFAEAELNRSLRHRKMVARKTATLSAARLALPSDWLEAVNIEVSGRVPSRLRYLSPSDLDNARDAAGGDSGIPLYYTLVGDELEVAPAPSSSATVEMLYRAKLPALATNTTNWLLVEHPDLYLFGTLAQALPWLEGDPRAQSWVDTAARILGAVNAQDERSRFSGGPLVRRMQTFG
jgi:hypothetical protein